MRQLIGALVELAIGQTSIGCNQGAGLRGLAGLAGDEVVDTPLLWVGHSGGVPFHQQFMALSSGEERELGDRSVWGRDNPCE